MPLPAVFAIAAAVSLVAAAAFILTMRREPAVRALYDKIPRERISGTILGAVVLIWCIPNIRPIFMPESPFQSLIVPLMLVAIVLAAIFLNYLFARAAAAVLILGAHAVLKAAYPVQLPGYPVLAALLLLAGVIGIVISAKPYWLRDWFRLSFRNAAVRWTSAAFFLLLGAMSCYCAVEA
ncbi:MAG: hypothetical protein J6Y92_00070 [Lentisphaeria bacterium]|nr:hypothetical protein [Lentisphaeria bacterium]